MIDLEFTFYTKLRLAIFNDQLVCYFSRLRYFTSLIFIFFLEGIFYSNVTRSKDNLIGGTWAIKGSVKNIWVLWANGYFQEASSSEFDRAAVVGEDAREVRILAVAKRTSFLGNVVFSLSRACKALLKIAVTSQGEQHTLVWRRLPKLACLVRCWRGRLISDC